ncbi:MAG: family 78 glycoside hydrolase catalytic domain [Bacteroidota bacterium]
MSDTTMLNEVQVFVPKAQQKMKRIIFYSILFIVSSANALQSQVTVTNLKCEWLTNPLGIDVKIPRLSWQLQSTQKNIQQTGYTIIVASSAEKLKKNEGDTWNSGRVNSDASILVSYKGKELKSGKKYYWKIKSFTNKGESGWSEMAYWSAGLLNIADWKAKWIGYDKTSSWDSVTQWSRLSARYFRKQFQSGLAVKRAIVYISGLGLYELFLNGKKVGDRILAPAPTDYRRSVLYNTYDVTDEIQHGNNAIAAVLGNGRFFTMRQAYKPKKINTFGYPKMLVRLEIEYADGKKKIVVSDESWKLNVDGPIRTNNEYDGEEYDATKESSGWSNIDFNDSKWLKPELVKAPMGKLKAQMNPPIKIMRSIAPISLKKIDTNKFILDMGQNFSGWIKMTVTGKRNDKVVMRFAESLKTDGSLYRANLRDAKVTDSYTLKGGNEETWQPSFVYHGFRYVEVQGYPGEPAINNFEGELVFDDLATIGSFACSDSTINSIVRNAWWGIASDYKGMPIDCPQRNERQPWLGDRATGSTGESFLFDNAALYSKWLDDIEESQTVQGSIPDVAPAFWNYYSDNVTWPGTYILVADMLHRQFGDEQSIVKHYSSMKKWMRYMKDKYMKDFIVTKDKYGDWCVPPESLELTRSRDSMRNTNGALLATAYYYRLLQIMKRFAVISKKNNDVTIFDELGSNIRKAFNKKFFNESLNQYDNNTVTANLLPLYFGMVPNEKRSMVFGNIYKKLQENNMHISTGVIGTQWLMRGLTENNQPQAAFTLASNTTYPGWGYMIGQGATTIWELWNGNTANPQMNSQNHIMLLGDLLIWMFENLGGIKSTDSLPAFKQVIMKPSFVDGLYEANADYQSPYGKISSHWKKQADQLTWNIEIPANASAIIYIPAKAVNDIKESGQATAKSTSLQLIKFENGVAVIKAGSGQYQFVSAIK